MSELDERVDGPLRVDDGAAVLDRLERAAVGDAAGDLVGEAEAEPEPELEDEVPPSAGEIAADGGHVGQSSEDAGSVFPRIQDGYWCYKIGASRRCRTSRPWAGRPSPAERSSE